MKMKEAEARTGLDRKNIRYYESEELLAPRRTEGNRYRDYSEEDIASAGNPFSAAAGHSHPGYPRIF